MVLMFSEFEKDLTGKVRTWVQAMPTALVERNRQSLAIADMSLTATTQRGRR